MCRAARRCSDEPSSRPTKPPRRTAAVHSAWRAPRRARAAWRSCSNTQTAQAINPACGGRELDYCCPPPGRWINSLGQPTITLGEGTLTDYPHACAAGLDGGRERGRAVESGAPGDAPPGRFAARRPSTRSSANAMALLPEGCPPLARAPVDDGPLRPRMSASSALGHACSIGATEAVACPPALSLRVARAALRELRQLLPGTRGRQHASPVARATGARRLGRAHPSNVRSGHFLNVTLDQCIGCPDGKWCAGGASAAAAVQPRWPLWQTRLSPSRAPLAPSGAKRARRAAPTARSSRFAAPAARRPPCPLAPSAAAAASAAQSSARNVRVTLGGQRNPCAEGTWSNTARETSMGACWHALLRLLGSGLDVALLGATARRRSARWTGDTLECDACPVGANCNETRCDARAPAAARGLLA